jgi:hypothetical protein
MRAPGWSACIVAAVVAALAAPTAAPRAAAASDQAKAFLMTAFKLSAAEIGRIDSGHAVTRTLEVKNRREVATLGIVRIKTTPAAYAERLTDIVSFKRTDDVLQIGTFSHPSQPADVAPLTIDDADLKGLRECRVDDCPVRLPADAIGRLKRDIDWHAPDASRRATQLMHQLFVDYVARYRQNGAAATMEYADRSPRLNVGQEFASLIDADTVTGQYASPLYRHLLQYPASSDHRMTDFVYWSKELVRSRPVISITHVAIAPGAHDGPVAYAIGSKQIYAMHYFDASLGLTLLLPDRSSATPATYVVYVNRSRIDLFEGFFGGMARKIVAGKARGLVAEQLLRLQGILAGSSTQRSTPFGR